MPRTLARLGESEARQILDGDGDRSASSVAFPNMKVGRTIQDLHLSNSDLSNVRFDPPWRHSMEIRGCTFDGVNFGSGDFRKVAIVDSVVTDSDLGGFITNTRFERATFEACTFNDLIIQNLDIVDSVIRSATFKDVSWTSGLIRSTRIDGEMDNANWRRIRFVDADLSELRMFQTALVDWSGTVRLPELPNCFVVRPDALSRGSAAVRLSVSLRSFETYEAIALAESGSADPLVIDAAFFEWVPRPDLDQITIPERELILETLYPFRMSGLTD